ncbi:rCG36751, partial [Rattus norvegicus]
MMARIPLLFILLTLCSGSVAESQLSQEASMFGSVGQKVTLVCTGTGGDVGAYD